MRTLISLLLYIKVELERVLDHLWRKTTGFPTLKRSVITPNLYLGGQYKIKSVYLLKKLGVTGIVNMRLKDIYKEDVLLREFHILHLPTSDQHAPSMAQLKSGVTFIDKELKNKGKVYIHCREGEGRGPTMAIAYLIYNGMTFDDAYALVRKNRTFIRPSASQLVRLKEFENRVKGIN